MNKHQLKIAVCGAVCVIVIGITYPFVLDNIPEKLNKTTNKSPFVHSDNPNELNKPASKSLSSWASFPGPIPDSSMMRTYTQRSDAVLVGTITDFASQKATSLDKNGKPVEGQNQEGTLVVEAVYKGNLQPAEKLKIQRFIWERMRDLPMTSLRPGERCLYFLTIHEAEKNGRVKSVTPIDPFYSCLRVSSQRPKTAFNSVGAAVKAELLQNLKDGDENLIIDTLERLEADKEAREICTLQLSKSSSAVVRNEALAYRLRSNDVTAIESAITFLLNADQGDSEGIQRVRNSFSGVAKKVTKPQLLSLFNAERPEFDFIIGDVIRQTDKAEFASIAIGLLKRNTEVDAQIDTLALLSRLRHIPGPDPFEFADHKQKYIKEYLDWWEMEGKKLYELEAGNGLR